jgi:hypothetical protein
MDDPRADEGGRPSPRTFTEDQLAHVRGLVRPGARPVPAGDGVEEVAQVRMPLSDASLEALESWMEAAYGSGLVVLGGGDWLTFYRAASPDTSG